MKENRVKSGEMREAQDKESQTRKKSRTRRGRQNARGKREDVRESQVGQLEDEKPGKSGVFLKVRTSHARGQASSPRLGCSQPL